jgi:hypothetical protein
MHHTPARRSLLTTLEILKSRSFRAAAVMLMTVAALAGPAACDSDVNTAATGTTTQGPATVGAGGLGGQGTGGAGGVGGVGGLGGQGGVVDPGCKTDQDCAGEAKNKLCETESGICVECFPANDTCPAGQYCADNDICAVGCTDESDCTASTVCNAATHKCVGCNIDTDCPSGSICINTICTPGCSGSQPCQVGFSCCGQVCYDFENDTEHCGDCVTVCVPPPHTTATCVSGNCGGDCILPWADCNQDPLDGCEWNTLQDGPCTCVPGDTQTCYNGAPGTLGIGACVAGVQTCDPSGQTWGPCVGQVLPQPEKCNAIDDDCDGAPEAAGCVNCIPKTGSCNGEIGTYCKDDGLSYGTEACDPVNQGTTCNPGTGRCDGECGLKALGTSYIGCDYFPTVTGNLVSNAFHFAVAVSNTSATPANILITQGATTMATATVGANSVQVINLPWVSQLKGPTSNNVLPFPASVRVNQGAYRLRSNKPVTVYQFSPIEYTNGGSCNVQANCSFSNDASILLPVNVWTGNYRVAARHHFAGGSGYYVVTAKDDNTTVTVAPGPTSGLVKTGIPGINANGTGQVVLNAGDVIEVVTNGGVSQNDPNDVTGSLVTSDKPVQVIGGHQCIYIPYNVGYCDHIEETIFPYETLGSQYIVTAPLIPTGGQSAKVEFVRVVATKPNTTLTYDPPQQGAPTMIALAGGWIELENNANDFRITANEPILVVQYMEGQDAGGNSGDPSMTVAVAQDQYRDSYLFHAPTNYEYSYINIVAPAGTVVKLDGVTVQAFAPIGNTGFSIARESLSNAGNGNHTITASKPVGISVYGYGQYTSYWYPGGSNLIQLHD